MTQFALVQIRMCSIVISCAFKCIACKCESSLAYVLTKL